LRIQQVAAPWHGAQQCVCLIPEQSPDVADGLDVVARWKWGLKVIGHGTMRRYKGQFADPREVGRELGVAHVLTGRVRREGERVRIAVEMVETGGGRVVWTQPFDVERSELPGSIGDIAGGIGKAMPSRSATSSPSGDGGSTRRRPRRTTSRCGAGRYT